jgi:hypothetical protein
VAAFGVRSADAEAADHWVLSPTRGSVENQRVAAFVERLRELGWIEGRTVAMAQLRRMLQSYARYYNETHRSLNKDAPLTRPVQRSGRIVSHAMVGGLHHQYVRI